MDVQGDATLRNDDHSYPRGTQKGEDHLKRFEISIKLTLSWLATHSLPPSVLLTASITSLTEKQLLSLQLSTHIPYRSPHQNARSRTSTIGPSRPPTQPDFSPRSHQLCQTEERATTRDARGIRPYTESSIELGSTHRQSDIRRKERIGCQKGKEGRMGCEQDKLLARRRRTAHKECRPFIRKGKLSHA